MVAAVPVKEGLETVPVGVTVPEICVFVPEKVGCDTVPAGVPVTLIVASVPVNDAVYVLGTGMLPVTRRTPVPLNVGCDTLPAGVPVTLIVASVPLNDAVGVFGTAILPVTRRTAVPENDAEVIPLATVALENDGRVTAVGVFAVPAVIVRVSFDTEYVGIVQAVPAVTEPPPVALDATYLVDVVGVTVTEPAGVYVVVPLDAADTVAVLFSVPADVTVTEPAGV